MSRLIGNLLVDDDGDFVGVRNPTTGEDTFVVKTEGNAVPLVVSADAPSDADGRPDGTIYIQTA